MVGTQRSRVWWVHRGAGYGEYTKEQGMVVHRGAGYGGYTEEQGMVGTPNDFYSGLFLGYTTMGLQWTKHINVILL